MDVMGGVLLDDGTDLKLVTGVDDHSRFCVAAGLVQTCDREGGVDVFKASMLTLRRPRRGADRQRQGVHRSLRGPTRQRCCSIACVARTGSHIG